MNPNETEPVEILVATKNRGKLRELNSLLGGLPVELKSLEDFAEIAEVEETGLTFAENAAIKAIGYAAMTGLPAIADDSGLEVEALGGRPGVLSARYGGSASYHEKIALLLDEMARSGLETRNARFVCSMALALPSGEVSFTAEGICSGVIAESPSGEGGFGYDPVFIPEGHGQTFAELPESVKQEISHRARAAKIIMRYLPDFIGI